MPSLDKEVHARKPTCSTARGRRASAVVAHVVQRLSGDRCAGNDDAAKCRRRICRRRCKILRSPGFRPAGCARHLGRSRSPRTRLPGRRTKRSNTTRLLVLRGADATAARSASLSCRLARCPRWSRRSQVSQRSGSRSFSAARRSMASNPGKLRAPPCSPIRSARCPHASMTQVRARPYPCKRALPSAPQPT